MNDWNEERNDSENGGYNNEDYAFQTLMRNGRPKTIAWSVASLVVGILSVVCCCFGWSGLVLGALAIVFAILSRRDLGYFDGLSIAGLVLGIFGAIFGIAMIVSTFLIPEEFWEEYKKQLDDLYNQGGVGGYF